MFTTDFGVYGRAVQNTKGRRAGREHDFSNLLQHLRGVVRRPTGVGQARDASKRRAVAELQLFGDILLRLL